MGLEITTNEQPYFTTALITPDKTFILLETCMYSVTAAEQSQEKWARIFSEQGSRATIRLSNEMQFFMSAETTEPTEPTEAEEFPFSTSFVQVATFFSDKYDNFVWASEGGGEWQIITARFIVTDLSSEHTVLTAYYSLNHEGDRVARLRIALHLRCVGQEKTMEYYDRLPGSLFED